MQTATFKDWTLNRLEKTFDLKQVWESDLLEKWQNIPSEITEVETTILLKFQKLLIHGGRSWNETELENKFISPLIMLSDINNDNMGYFLERPLSAQIGDYQLSGIVDGMIATGFREPDIPLFCMHEYKRNIENQGSPDAQVLAAMLVARELNQNKLPIYGLFVVGLVWNFMVLEGNHYCISHNYTADTDDVFQLFKMLKNLKQLIEESSF
ncbi:MAG: hypothetical protein RL637_1486 [Pseudomonadota bacterium]|jgi:hypothetical protein